MSTTFNLQTMFNAGKEFAPPFRVTITFARASPPRDWESEVGLEGP